MKGQDFHAKKTEPYSSACYAIENELSFETGWTIVLGWTNNSFVFLCVIFASWRLCVRCCFERMDLLKTVLVLVLLVTACARDTESLDPKQLQRMSVVRERLKNRLGEKYRQPVPQATPQQLARGQALYAQLCAPCHGPRGEGSGKNANRLSVKPTDFTDPQQASFYSEQARLYIIRKGIKGTPMMGWENVLSDADIVAVYLYIRSFMKGEESQ